MTWSAPQGPPPRPRRSAGLIFGVVAALGFVTLLILYLGASWYLAPVNGRYCAPKLGCYELDFERLSKDASDVPMKSRFRMGDGKKIDVIDRWNVYVYDGPSIKRYTREAQ